MFATNIACDLRYLDNLSSKYVQQSKRVHPSQNLLHDSVCFHHVQSSQTYGGHIRGHKVDI